MKATYFTNNGTEVSFERGTFDECVNEYYRRRKTWPGAHWGRVYINGERVWL